ncbi:MAG: HDOD domain-containing protein [Burkholderiales bacterium]
MNVLTQDLPVAAVIPPALGPEDREPLAALFSNWERLTHPGHALPPLSPLAMRLIELDPEAPNATARIIAIIGSDPTLTARVLGLSNAAAFTSSGKLIYDVKSAVLRLGLNTTIRVALAQLAGVWMRKAAKTPDPRLLRPLWIEYLITAFCAHEIAWMLADDAVPPGIAYIAGLLHDIGTIALMSAAPELMSRFLAARLPADDPLQESFVEAHSRLGAALLQQWGAPTLLVEVAERHHAGASQDESIGSVVVFLADQFHERVLERIPDRLGIDPAMRLGCAVPSDTVVTAAAAALDLTNQIELILDNVAEDSGRIESLAADLS